MASLELSAQGFLSATRTCEDLVPKNKDKSLNVHIAQQCKKAWETNAGIGLAGPFGTYKRHSYDGTSTIDRDDFGNIVSKTIVVSVIIQNKKGKCKVAYILFKRAYEGGSSYGMPGGGYVHGSSDNIDCACIETLPDWLGTDNVKGSSGSTGSSSKENAASKPDKTIKDGPYEYKSSSGDFAESGTYAAGKKTGLWTQYGSDGKISSEKNYLDGKLNGTSKSFTNGVLRKVEEYKDDVLDGVYKEYDDAGNILYNIAYKNGKKHGNYISYKNNEVTCEREYIEGEQSGKTTNYRSGKRYEEINYVMGKKNGEATKYYIETGTIQSTETYKNDKRDGPYKSYSKTEKLEAEGNYKDGLKDGEWKKYDASGKVIEKLFYVEGKQEE